MPQLGGVVLFFKAAASSEASLFTCKLCSVEEHHGVLESLW